MGALFLDSGRPLPVRSSWRQPSDPFLEELVLISPSSAPVCRAQDAMDRGRDSSARSISRDSASSQLRATKASKFSRRLKLPRPFLGDDRLKKTGRSLYTRADAEHVVLADCRTSNGVVSSEMAYFSGSPDSTPDDTAVVDTSYDTTQQWANATTSTLFSDTGTTFTAVLRPDVAQGDWAGTGNNGYGSFVCWETSFPNLYYDDAVGTECSGVYDCDHEETPSKCLPCLSNTLPP